MILISMTLVLSKLILGNEIIGQVKILPRSDSLFSLIGNLDVYYQNLS
jgi:hypothetical protein